MFRNFRLWLMLLKAKLRHHDPEIDKAAREEIERGRELANRLVGRQRAAFHNDGIMMARLYDAGIARDMELLLLWGAFHELVQEYPQLPTNGFDRVKAHIILHLVETHGYSFEKGRDAANKTEYLYNQSDANFDEIIELGKKAFRNEDEGLLLSIFTSSQTEDSLEWSSHPAAHESHLKKRHNNPYFRAERRIVSREELEEAKRKDREDCDSCVRRFAEIGEELKSLSQTVTSGHLLDFRERVEDLIFFARGVGGPANDIAQLADGLRATILETLREAFSNDEKTLANIENADLYHMDSMRRFHVPVLAQLLREDSPIPKDEWIETMLSEEPDTICICMNTLPENVAVQIRLEALKLMQQAYREDGYIDPEYEDKIDALEGNWPRLKDDDRG